jgi:diguanylate cyclase (GGDEF)-like protein
VSDQTVVMVVEDDPASRRIMSHLLRRSGYTVLVAEDGNEAFEQIRPDVAVALIDWMMPGADGIEVCRRLKQVSGDRAYAIMVTARGDKPAIVHALNEGADDYVVKPVDHAELLARVRAGERVALRGRRLEEAWAHARSEAERDPLTGLFTRRVFDEVLGRSMQSGATVSLLMIDLDHFKRVNDRYGHLAGDEVLRSVAATISAGVRSGTDLAARYGGEEIAVIVPGTHLPGALELAERIRRDVSDLHVVVARELVPVTVSVGVATAAGGEMSPQQLVGLADARLYAAKEQGRNTVAA